MQKNPFDDEYCLEHGMPLRDDLEKITSIEPDKVWFGPPADSALAQYPLLYAGPALRTADGSRLEVRRFEEIEKDRSRDYRREKVSLVFLYRDTIKTFLSYDFEEQRRLTGELALLRHKVDAVYLAGDRVSLARVRVFGDYQRPFTALFSRGDNAGPDHSVRMVYSGYMNNQKKAITLEGFAPSQDDVDPLMREVRMATHNVVNFVPPAPEHVNDITLKPAAAGNIQARELLSTLEALVRRRGFLKKLGA